MALVIGGVVVAYVVLRVSGWPECGSGVGCLGLAEKYQLGQVVPRDLVRAQRLFEKACARGAVAGCVQAGRSYQRGNGGDPDLEKAAVYFDRACTAEDAEGCLLLSRAYVSGAQVLDSPGNAPAAMSRAVGLFERACASGESQSCARLFLIFVTGDGVTKDRSRAAGFGERACLLGETSACGPAGLLYLNVGGGSRRDVARAAQLLERGCKDNVGRACCALATTYGSTSSTIGVEGAAQTNGLLQKACSLGEGQACIAFYSGADRASKIVQRALGVFSESCATPYPTEGCSGVCEKDDDRSRSRRDEALRTLQRACDENDGEACFVLGLIYNQSVGGVDGDANRAAALLKKACAVDVASACDRLAYLSPR